MRYLLLFDIDGTLVRCGPQVRPLFRAALEQAFDRPLDRHGYASYPFSGKTDTQIVIDLMERHGVDREDARARVTEVREAYLGLLEGGLRRDGMVLLPGVIELLDRLAGRDDVVLGLLTGNWRGGAEIKLGRFDLWHYFPFGAFGDDAVVRRELVPIALERAAASSGHSFAKENVVIIGDSELDVDCARAGGVRSLAVATGFTSIEQLAAEDPDWVFPDLVHAVREITFLQE